MKKAVTKLSAEPIGICEKCGGTNKLLVTVGETSREVNCLCDCENDALLDDERIQNEMRKNYYFNQLKAETFGVSGHAKIPSFDDCDDQTDREALSICKSYTARFDDLIDGGHGLILYGSPDQGKTFMAKCIANELYKSNAVRVITAATYVDMCTGFDRLPGGKIRSESIYALCDLLVLDDLGSERITSFATECLFDLINTRYERMLPTIVTTNYSIEEMSNPETMMQARMFERLMERCLPVRIENGRKRVSKNTHEEIKDILHIQ